MMSMKRKRKKGMSGSAGEGAMLSHEEGGAVLSHEALKRRERQRERIMKP